jgi:hypothetical protein
LCLIFYVSYCKFEEHGCFSTTHMGQTKLADHLSPPTHKLKDPLTKGRSSLEMCRPLRDAETNQETRVSLESGNSEVPSQMGECMSRIGAWILGAQTPIGLSECGSPQLDLDTQKAAKLKL